MPAGYSSSHILIVDDNVAAAKTLRLVLSTEGLTADHAASASEAREMASRIAYDAALIDIGLPGQSGIELLGDLKEAYPQLVCIIVTGQASAETSIEAINRGAGGYIRKPVDVHQLLALLRSALEKQRLEAENRRMLRRLSLLYAVGAQVSGGLEAETTLQETISLVTSLLDLPAGGIWWARGPDGAPSLAACFGLPPALESPLADRIAQFEAQDAGWKMFSRTWEDVEITVSEGEPPWLVRIIPLQGHEGTTGYMAIAGQDWAGDRTEEAEVLGTVAWQVGAAMENMRLYADLRIACDRLQEAQARVIQAEKLSAVGRVVSGVAHELNNPLMVVLGYADLLREGVAPHEVPVLAERIYTQAERAGRIIQGLLSFSRRERTVLRPTDLRPVIDAALESTARLRGDNVRLVLDVPEVLPLTSADPGGMQQVFANIIGNAAQAMGEAGGVLTVACEVGEDTIIFTISDTGPGIPEDVLPRIFDPFFTTKGVGQGTGLGLSVSHGIVHDHGGEITAANNPQGGAAFTIRLPIREVAPMIEGAAETSAQDAPWLVATGGE